MIPYHLREGSSLSFLDMSRPFVRGLTELLAFAFRTIAEAAWFSHIHIMCYRHTGPIHGADDGLTRHPFDKDIYWILVRNSRGREAVSAA